LIARGQVFVVIERDSQRLEWIQERNPDVLALAGDVTLDVNLLVTRLSCSGNPIR
jgi:hypothetical protein